MKRTHKKAAIRLTSVQADMMSEQAEMQTVLEQMEKVLAGEEVTPMNGCDAPDSVVIETEGLIRRRDGRIEVEYFEPDQENMGKSCTKISFDEAEPGIVMMSRTGDTAAAMVFEEGKRSTCLYDTPLMRLEIAVAADKVVNRMDENGGSMELWYNLEHRGQLFSYTQLKIEVSVDQ